jgi:glycosyltransferase involved in cell wall biosynthesis
MPAISIIIPVYNAESLIGNTLETIRAQTFEDFEVLVMDGLSTDRTMTIVNDYAAKDARIRSKSAKDRGIYDAMNKGIEESKGDWLLFLGADDLLINDTVLARVSAHLATGDADMVYGNVQIKGNAFWAKDGDIYDGEFSVEKLFQRNICHQAIFYRKQLFQKLGNYNIAYRICADWDFNHRCFAKCRVQYMDEVISIFPIGGLSTIEVSDQFSEDIIPNLRSYYGISVFNSFFKVHSWAFFTLAKKEAAAGHLANASTYFLASFAHSERKMLLARSYLKSVFNAVRTLVKTDQKAACY